MKRILHILVFIFGVTMSAKSQTGEIQGKVVDDKGAPAAYCTVRIVEDEQGNRPTSKGARADANGRYTIKGLNPGKYNVMAQALGKPKEVEIGVQVFVGRPTTVDFALGSSANVVKGVTVTGKKATTAKLIDVFAPKENVIGAEEIKDNTVRDVNSLAGATGQVVQSDFGADLNVAGGRADDNTYFIDGVKVIGSANVPPSAIGQLEVITSGIPAKYGDATAGVISITTKGPPDRISGGAEIVNSKFLDPYGFLLFNGNLSGPLIRRKFQIDSTNPAYSALKNEKGDVALGFLITGEYQHDDDKFPAIVGNYKIKDNVFQQLQNVPYVMSNDGKAIITTQQTVNANDIEKTKSHQNTSGRSIRFTGKLDWKVNRKGTNITMGGGFNLDKYNDIVIRYQLFNYYNNPVKSNNTYRGYLRWYQPLFNSERQVDKVIKNTTMQIQFDYERTGEDYYSPLGGTNPWNYGYTGKFKQHYAVTSEDINNNGTAFTNIYYGPNANDFIQATKFVRSQYSQSYVTFEKGNVNPMAANFMDYFYNLYNTNIGRPVNIDELQNAGALTNGTRATLYNNFTYYPMSRIYNGIQYEKREQFRVSGNLNFDIVGKKSTDLNKHTIEIGFEIEQRYRRRYRLSPNALYAVATSSVNSHLSQAYDQNYNPLLIMQNGTVSMRLQDYVKQLNSPNAVIFGELDTVFYDKNVSTGTQTNFSRNFRAHFGLDSLSNVDVNSYTPDQMQLNFFSADELLRNGNVSVVYSGYNYLGELVPNNTTFNSFFTEKDANGNYKRNVAPSSPFYAAGYIQDRFQLKSIAFNIGLRADYFNSNSYAFIDPYVPQRARTKADVAGQFTNQPTNIPNNAYVYVDNAISPTTITGYRVGSQWYSSTGDELYGPRSIISKSGGQINPYLVGNNEAERAKYNMNSSTFDPNLMFEKAKGILNIMPRLNFSFQIDTNSLIFAHFDRLSRRPDDFITYSGPLDYYNLLVGSGSTIPNANMKSPKTTDLELGFRQRLSHRSAMTLNFFYREYIDNIQLTQISGAYPKDYYTYSNSDFSTVKGFGLSYELRRTNNVRVKANYTMQFADGTGSSSTSQLNLITAGAGNLKVIAPLNFDVRHMLNLDFNYSFADGVNYIGPAKMRKFFQNSGISVIGFLRSGTPYTLQSNINEAAFIDPNNRAITLGDINSGRVPWGYNVNLKVDKDFRFKFGKKPTDSTMDDRRSGGITVYLQIRNLLNTLRTLNVYRYTGSASDDGYLSSPAAQTEYQNAENQLAGKGQSFRDLYRIALEMPTNELTGSEDVFSFYAQPRIIQLGILFSF